MADDLRPALASLWRSRTSTAETDFLCSAAFVGPGLLLTAGHVFEDRPAAEVFVRPAVDATLAYPITALQRHGELDAALVRIERHPPGARVLPVQIDPTVQPGDACTLNGYFEGRLETGLPLRVLNWDPAARWFVIAPRQPAGHSGSAICDGDRLWGLSVEHYVDPTVDRGCAIALHQLWRGWLQALLPAPPPTAATSAAAPAPTEIAAFVGQTERGPGYPTLVCSMAEYQASFGPPLPASQSFLGAVLQGYFDNGGTRAYVVRALSPQAMPAAVSIATDDPEQRLHVEALHAGAFGNGLLVGVEPGARDGLRLFVAELRGRSAQDAADDPVEDHDNLSIDDDGPSPLLRVVHSRSRRVALRWENAARPGAMPQTGLWLLAGGSDGDTGAEDLVGTGAAAPGHGSGLHALDPVGDDLGLVCLPDAVHARFSAEQQSLLRDELIAFAERHRCLAVLALPRDQGAADRPRAPGTSSYAAVYLPWITVATPDGREADLPPVGHLAGAIARHTAQAGLADPPLGLALRGILRLAGGPGVDCADARAVQALDRRGVNLLCHDAASGRVLVATAVTMARDEAWQPIHVRRFHSFVERHVERLLAWAAFEPPGEATWAAVRQRLEAFLTDLWRDGLLAGSRPEEAFFVRCDRSTMTADDIDNGRVLCQFGYALAGPGTADAGVPDTPMTTSIAVGRFGR